MVEFGAPLESTYIASKALGLDFVCNTDHSYDIDDKIGSWIEPDENLTKWNNSQILIKKMNLENKFNNFIIPSEELSLHNSKGFNIHALILNNKTFLIIGAGINTNSSPTIKNYKATSLSFIIKKKINNNKILKEKNNDK